MTLDEAIKIVQPPFVMVLVFKSSSGMGIITEGDNGNGFITKEGRIDSPGDVAEIVKDFFEQ